MSYSDHPRYFAGITAANTSLRRGLVYALAEDGLARLDHLIYAMLRQADAHGVCLVAPRRQLGEIVACGPAGALAAQLADGHLTMFESAFTGGAGQVALLAEELAQVGRQAHQHSTTVLLDHADVLFGEDVQHNLVLARQLRDWAERDNKILVLVLRSAQADALDPMRVLRPCAALFGGIARLCGRQGQQTWQTFHWHHADGVSSDIIQPLLVDDAGACRLAPPQASRNAAPADDEALHMLALRGALLGGETAGAGWQLLDDAATLQAEAAIHPSATLMLPFDGGASFDGLARTVLDLRRSCGRRVKIVVRELHQHMRQSQEALLMHLGANLVMPAGISLSRASSLCVAVRDQVFQHELPASYEMAVAAAMPEQQQGYLAPDAFLAAVQSSMQRCQEYRIESCMVRLTLVKGLTPLDALRYCQTRRAGDLVTADADAVYLFLYACREADLAAAMKSLLRLPLSELFSVESRYPTARDIADACAALARRARGVADLGAALAATTIQQPGKALASAAVAVAGTTNNGPAPQRHVAVAPASRRPLPLVSRLTVAWTAP